MSDIFNSVLVRETLGFSRMKPSILSRSVLGYASQRICEWTFVAALSVFSGVMSSGCDDPKALFFGDGQNAPRSHEHERPSYDADVVPAVSNSPLPEGRVCLFWIPVKRFHSSGSDGVSFSGSFLLDSRGVEFSDALITDEVGSEIARLDGLFNGELSFIDVPFLLDDDGERMLNVSLFVRVNSYAHGNPGFTATVPSEGIALTSDAGSRESFPVEGAVSMDGVMVDRDDLIEVTILRYDGSASDGSQTRATPTVRFSVDEGPRRTLFFVRVVNHSVDAAFLEPNRLVFQVDDPNGPMVQLSRLRFGFVNTSQPTLGTTPPDGVVSYVISDHFEIPPMATATFVLATDIIATGRSGCPGVQPVVISFEVEDFSIVQAQGGHSFTDSGLSGAHTLILDVHCN
jgi:hypothetical protein